MSGDSGESTVVVVSVQLVCRLPPGGKAIESAAGDEECVDVPIVVIIQQCYATTQRFNDVFLGGVAAAVEDIVEPGASGDVGELHR